MILRDFMGYSALYPFSSVNYVVSELLAEEIRLKSQAVSKGILPTPNQFVFALSSRPYSSNSQ